MPHLNRTRSPQRGLPLWLAVLVVGLFFQALVPRGYMPVHSGLPGQLVLCPAKGPLPALLPNPDATNPHGHTHHDTASVLVEGSAGHAGSGHENGHVDGHIDGHSDGHTSLVSELCPWGSAPLAHDLLTPLSLALPVLVSEPLNAPALGVGRSGARPPLPARGPPHTAHV